MYSTVMKYTVLLVSAASIIVVSATAPFEDYRNACIEELHLDASKFPPRPPHVDGSPRNVTPMELTHDMSCLMRCMLQKDGFLNSRDELQMDRIKTHLATDIDLSKCEEIATSDPCDTVAEKHKCVMKLLPNPPHVNQ